MKAFAIWNSRIHAPRQALTTYPPPAIWSPAPALSLPPWRESPATTQPHADVPPSLLPSPSTPRAGHPELPLVQSLPAPPTESQVVPQPKRQRGWEDRGHGKDRGLMEGGDSSGWALRGGSGLSRQRQEGCKAQDHEEGWAAYRLRVGERPEAVVVLLPCRVPQPQVHGLAVHHHVG